MNYRKIVSLSAVSLVCLSGCFIGTPAKQREIQIRQLVFTQDSWGDRFDVDTSSIPADWIEAHTIRTGPHGDISVIKLAPGKAIKLALVPASR